MNSHTSAFLHYTLRHFQEIARQNRFPENGTIDHDVDRCVICHPELVPSPPFVTYLEVVTQSIKVRRPVLDQALVDDINKDLELVGSPLRVTLEALQNGEEESVPIWKDWLRDAIATGLELLSVHSATCLEFTLDDGERAGMADLIESKIEELMNAQQGGTFDKP
jgi:hypothetical protein